VVDASEEEVMASLDRHDIDKALYTLLNVAGLQTELGNPIRMYYAVPSDVVYPFVALSGMPAGPRTSHGTAAGKRAWIRRHGIQFTVFTQSRSLDDASRIQKLIADLMDTAPSDATVTGGVITEAIPGVEFCDYDPDTGDATAWLEYTLTVEAS
jgi:hypothetical protein